MKYILIYFKIYFDIPSFEFALFFNDALMKSFTGMHTFVNGTYTGIEISPGMQEGNAFCFISARVNNVDVGDVFFICTGVNDHEYVIYDPRDDSEEDWDYWNLICRVIFNIALLSLKMSKLMVGIIHK